MTDFILEMRQIGKTFPGVKALDQVNFQVKRGEIHALVGENGAGKSTLMKVLSGVYPYGQYEGEILFEGKECRFRDIRESEALGIVIIHQELALSPFLSIAENIFLGNERARFRVLDWGETYKQAQELMKRVGMHDSPQTLIKDIGIGKQQLVEIAKALAKNVKLLILDEPTAALNDEDSKNLLQLLRDLKSQGVTSILISHKLNEVMEIADSITILRDGRTIETLYVGQEELSEDRIIRGMVGRELTNRFPPRVPNIGERLFEVKNWTVYHPLQQERKVIDNVSLYVRRGEIVGIAGLMGAGRTELAMSIFGHSYGSQISGQVFKDGKEIRTNSVHHVISSGIAYVSEDRKNYGLNLIDNVKRNMTLARLDKISRASILDLHRENQVAEHLKEAMNVKTPSVVQIVGNLSGGNQQKVVLSKWIFTDPDVLILDEPTRGIDVGAKYEIYTIIHQLAAEGKGIIVISSELPEIIGLSDRIYVLNSGRITGELLREEADQEKLMRLMTGARGQYVANVK